MCRFIAYFGEPILLEDLLYRPSNSLILQSYKAKERPEPLNGDGFGVGWYAPEVDYSPCLQRYITPAWSNRNLKSLARVLKTSHLFAHIRAASPGMIVGESNVHPFAYKNLMFMHNGVVAQFEKVKRKLRDSLQDEFYKIIYGTTDSEHAFALFLNNLTKPSGQVEAADMRQALVKTIHQLDEWTNSADIKQPSYYNFAVSNGREAVISRYCSIPEMRSASLHYSRGAGFNFTESGEFDVETVADSERAKAVIISSEKLTDDGSDFPDVPHNHTVTVREDLTIELEAI